eukprot:CAMPEP_0198518894 /NCGR_PEP_ID=MMETSP1462-20131121/19388_1 /TAXON_ID=1333877 /ORGANISM="Brandtodinium nutriculum, Strain RCC3387" /LENGTH=487 /DNA_ID=CAMNT_0044248491 /DNA_START=1 /DNA_END=1461 /DNA_ORIENTATION=-
MFEVVDSSVLAALFAIALSALVAARTVGWRGRQGRSAAAGAAGAAERDHVAYEDLVAPEVRGNHLAFNASLHKRFAGQRFVPVRGEERCFIAFTHATCKEVMNDHATFSSNPFPDDRLVALNTMSKADHARVLRYVHSFYVQGEVAKMEDRIRQVVELCTDDLESGQADAVVWAKRIHMASTLARLGVPVLGGGEAGPGGCSWSRVDEVVALNDAMVALVAPLGGVGRRYSELPRGQWLHVLRGLVSSLPATMRMTMRLGLRCTWEIVRPDVTVLFPPTRPRMGLWWHPELLPRVPEYFLSLHDLLMNGSADGPLAGIREGVAIGNLRLAEALTLMVQLMVNMTSANALANMVFRLGTEKAAAEAAFAEPDRLAPSFVQESLRLDAPLQRNPRRVARPLAGKWSGVPLREGDQVLLLLGAANMDPAVFDAPADFRMDREAADKGTALSFGSGMHYCLGSNLVRSEMRVALDCLLSRYAAVELRGEPQ